MGIRRVGVGFHRDYLREGFYVSTELDRNRRKYPVISGCEEWGFVVSFPPTFGIVDVKNEGLWCLLLPNFVLGTTTIFLSTYTKHPYVMLCVRFEQGILCKWRVVYMFASIPHLSTTIFFIHVHKASLRNALCAG